MTALVSDESFVRWIKGRADDAERIKWKVWVQQDPFHAALKKQAKLMYDIPMSIKSGDMEQQLSQLDRCVDDYDRKRRRSSGCRLIAAAAILVLAAVATFISLNGYQLRDTAEHVSLQGSEHIYEALLSTMHPVEMTKRDPFLIKDNTGVSLV